MKLTLAESHSLTEMLKENTRLAAELAESKRYEDQNHQRIRELESAIRWALGEEGEFPDEPEPQGKYRRKYYWRTELRKRARLTSETEGKFCTFCNTVHSLKGPCPPSKIKGDET